MSTEEVRGGANSEHRTKHDRKDAAHVKECVTCQRVESFLRSLRGQPAERGTWSEDLSSPVGVSRPRRGQ